MRIILLAMMFCVASVAFADHGTQPAVLSVDVRKGQPGQGGWMLSLTQQDVLYVGSYSTDDLNTAQVAHAVAPGSYERIRQMASQLMAGSSDYRGQACDGYLRDTVMVITSFDTADVLSAACFHAPTIAVRDRVADELRGLISQ